jgi:hypothetical protein
MEFAHNNTSLEDNAKILSSWSLEWLTTYFLAAVILLIVIYGFQWSNKSKLPIVNKKRLLEFSDNRVKRNFAANGRRLLREGLEQFHGKPFRIQTDFSVTIILPPSYAQELRNLDNLDHVKAIAQVSYVCYLYNPQSQN